MRGIGAFKNYQFIFICSDKLVIPKDPLLQILTLRDTPVGEKIKYQYDTFFTATLPDYCPIVKYELLTLDTDTPLSQELT